MRAKILCYGSEFERQFGAEWRQRMIFCDWRVKYLVKGVNLRDNLWLNSVVHF